MSAATLTMSKREFERAALMRKIHERRLTQAKAAEVLGLTLRQVERLYRKYRSGGHSALVSGKRPSEQSPPAGRGQAGTLQSGEFARSGLCG